MESQARLLLKIVGAHRVTESEPKAGDGEQDRLIQQIIELQRAFYFENKGKDSERRRRLREIIERATPGGR